MISQRSSTPTAAAPPQCRRPLLARRTRCRADQAAPARWLPAACPCRRRCRLRSASAKSQQLKTARFVLGGMRERVIRSLTHSQDHKLRPSSPPATRQPLTQNAKSHAPARPPDANDLDRPRPATDRRSAVTPPARSRCVVPYELRNAREPPNLRGHWLISIKEPCATYLADPGGRAGRRAPGYRLARLAWLLWAGAGQ